MVKEQHALKEDPRDKEVQNEHVAKEGDVSNKYGEGRREEC